VEINGFTRIIQKHGKDDLSQEIIRYAKLFYECEYQTAVQGQRRATTAHVSIDNLQETIDRFNRDGMIFTPCRRSGFYQGFAHQHKEVKPGDPYYWFGAVTRTVEDGLLFKEAEAKGDHQTMGKLLGYPECCTEYFTENFPVNYDPVWLGCESAPDGNPAVNILLRYFGIRVISHLACSPSCEGSLKQGVERIEIMRGMDREGTDRLLEFLSGPMTWDSYHGIVEIDTDTFIGVTHTFPILDNKRIIKWRC
jgi:hypothetical protein